MTPSQVKNFLAVRAAVREAKKMRKDSGRKGKWKRKQNFHLMQAEKIVLNARQEMS